ncbi:MAG TPA: hypothetical protein PK864_05455 [Syntrophorhabdaceae bacterium]|nr:hypothetical protein [Syntrophorhabdaceae bacterium]HOL05501.1 hypothetical protein [Syntrophorhabdaceae bacterium]HON85458.1 hypothetical protein [Syntrophorhabdaceae bacterium]HOT41421.1 hypothetical protein [Syntrophorhabdaceae bacterium]HPC66890.1 hypothetical protein [Syntrophorhabdaceae bacterium]
MKQEKIKAIIFLVIAGIFLVYAFYSKGDIKSFFSGVIFLVCGFIGFMYLKGDTKKQKKKQKKAVKR